jgi:hypothetical protein
MTYHPWRHLWRQHMPINRSARRSRIPSSTDVKRNRDEVVQVEIVGYCDPALVKKHGKNVEQMDA